MAENWPHYGHIVKKKVKTQNALISAPERSRMVLSVFWNAIIGLHNCSIKLYNILLDLLDILIFEKFQIFLKNFALE